MKKEERLFAALSGVDEELLERSEKKAARANRRWVAWGAALAACLAVAVAVHVSLPKEPEVTPPEPGISDLPAPPEVPQTPDPEVPHSADTRRLQCLQLGLDQDRRIPEFTFWMNEETYCAYEREGVYTVVPRDPVQVPEQELPECKLEIEYMDGSLDAAVEEVRNRLEGLYQTVTEIDWELADVTSGWPEPARYYFRGDNGVDWDSAQREVWLMPCAEGIFVLSSSYFLEAEEGHGARFADMARSFRPGDAENADAVGGAWMNDASTEVFRLTDAIMRDDLTPVQDLLAPGAEIDGYGEDVYDYVSISYIFISYGSAGPLDKEPPESATASVQHRMGAEDSYNFLTIELVYQDGKWLATWAGLEK